MDAHPTTSWHTLPDGRVQCDVCPRACRLHEGQRGLCTSPLSIRTGRRATVRRPPPATLRRARELARANGLRYVYTGNVHDRAGGSTHCHGCGEMLIERDWYTLGTWNLTDDGRCARRGTPCAGVFGGPPDDWGRTRLPVAIHR